MISLPGKLRLRRNEIVGALKVQSTSNRIYCSPDTDTGARCPFFFSCIPFRCSRRFRCSRHFPEKINLPESPEEEIWKKSKKSEKVRNDPSSRMECTTYRWAAPEMVPVSPAMGTGEENSFLFAEKATIVPGGEFSRVESDTSTDDTDGRGREADNDDKETEYNAEDSVESVDTL